jgi:hypothetical protein
MSFLLSLSHSKLWLSMERQLRHIVGAMTAATWWVFSPLYPLSVSLCLYLVLVFVSECLSGRKTAGRPHVAWAAKARAGVLVSLCKLAWGTRGPSARISGGRRAQQLAVGREADAHFFLCFDVIWAKGPKRWLYLDGNSPQSADGWATIFWLHWYKYNLFGFFIPRSCFFSVPANIQQRHEFIYVSCN